MTDSQYDKNIIRILLADDYPMVNEGLRMCLGTYDHINVVGTMKTGIEVLENYKVLQPDIIIMDINMPEMDGLETLERLNQLDPDMKVIILSMHSSREYVMRAVKNGAKGYLLKDVPLEDVIAAIEAINRGSTYFSSAASKLLFEDFDGRNVVLTNQEKRVLTFIAKGLSNKLIARELDISVRTAETHRRNIKRKLKLSSTAELTTYALEIGLLLLH